MIIKATFFVVCDFFSKRRNQHAEASSRKTCRRRRRRKERCSWSIPCAYYGLPGIEEKIPTTFLLLCVNFSLSLQKVTNQPTVEIGQPPPPPLTTFIHSFIHHQLSHMNKSISSISEYRLYLGRLRLTGTATDFLFSQVSGYIQKRNKPWKILPTTPTYSIHHPWRNPKLSTFRPAINNIHRLESTWSQPSGTHIAEASTEHNTWSNTSSEKCMHTWFHGRQQQNCEKHRKCYILLFTEVVPNENGNTIHYYYTPTYLLAPCTDGSHRMMQYYSSVPSDTCLTLF